MFNPYQQAPSFPSGIGDMVWINNKSELQSVTVAPNRQKVFFLRDADNPIFFVVSANEIGMISVTAYTFAELVEPKPEDKYVTKAEFEKLLEALGGKDGKSIIQTNQ